MSTKPTNQPVPSEKPQDLKFNAGKIDEFVTSIATQYQDRFGNSHYTIEGLKQLVLNQIYNLGWNPIGTFQGGAVITAAGEVIQDETNDVWYRWDDLATIPNTVHSGSTPGSTGGIGKGKWMAVDISDVLRRELMQPDGASHVMYGDDTVEHTLDSITTTSQINANLNPILSSSQLSAVEHYGIVQTGQSLAEGGVGYDQSLSNQSVVNINSYTLSGGPVGIATTVLGTKLTVLRERIRATIGVTLTDKILTSGLAKKAYFHGQAYGGMSYSDIKKGGSTGVYEKCITQASSLNLRIPSLIYKAVTFIHGEQDGVNNNTNYANNLGEWISNFNSD